MAPRFAFVPARWLAADSGLTPSDRLTLCILCIWVNRESGECWPSIATIAAHAALSENTVRASIKRLVSLGALEVERRRDAQGDSDTNLYTILGYDPPVKASKGGGSMVEVPVPQPLKDGTSTGAVEVLQPLHPNVVNDNKSVNGAPSSVASDEPTTSADTITPNRSRLDRVSDVAAAEYLAHLGRNVPRETLPSELTDSVS